MVVVVVMVVAEEEGDGGDGGDGDGDDVDDGIVPGRSHRPRKVPPKDVRKKMFNVAYVPLRRAFFIVTSSNPAAQVLFTVYVVPW